MPHTFCLMPFSGALFAKPAFAMKKILVFTLLTFALMGCNSLRNLNIVNPTYSLREVRPRVNLALPPSIDLDFTVGVDNPNSVSLRLDRLDFNLLINDSPILNNVRSDQGIHIPARGIGDVHLSTHVTYDNIRTIYREVSDIVQGNHARYTIQGNAYYDTPIGQMRFPVTVYSR
jgi:LEA14-like dessication related protein